ncbi:hypothetical protein [Streptomyces griseochromogenes]|uniref:hypothetical protein n=1 Tax=Streptomyces griseochromogenes TaxID=68214 RepID=UPI0037A67E30
MSLGEMYPVDPDDARVTNGPWLYGLMGAPPPTPSYSDRRPTTAPTAASPTRSRPCTPLTRGPGQPPADDEDGLAGRITAHVAR